MTEPETDEDLIPELRPASRFNKVWIIPIVAILLGAWLVKHSIAERGEIIVVTFESAEGIAEKKTEVRCRNVAVGTVEDIRLTDDLKVEVSLRIKPNQIHLLREDSQFWVERARVEGASISGLSTLIGGAFIQLDPGIGEQTIRDYKGLEDPPVTPSSVEGLRLYLTSKNPGSISIGSGIYFNDTPIGRIESRHLHTDSKVVEFGVFIEQEYSDLVTTNALFWQDSGVSLHIGADGFDITLPSLEAIVSGRITLSAPERVDPGKPVLSGHFFSLFNSKEAAETSTFQGGVEFLILVDESLRGLKVGSPVEFRGLKVGRVGEISYNLSETVDIEKMPVLVQLDTRLMATHFPEGLLDEGTGGFENAVKGGLKASLKSANLLTGQMYVDLDYYHGTSLTEIPRQGNYVVVPTIHTGLERLQDKVAALLDKMNELQLEGLIAKVGNTSDEATEALSNINLAMRSSKGVVADAQRTLQEMTDTMKSLKAILVQNDTKEITGDLRKTLAAVNKSLQPLSNDGAIYGDLRRTMDELRATVRSIDRLATEVADKPNSLLFGKDPATKKIPRARRAR